jgi:transposase
MKITQIQNRKESEKNMTKTRKRYTAEFKQEAIALWQASEKSAAEIEQDLGITAGILYQWQKESKKKATAAADGSADEAAEIKRLKKELALVKQERDILKKAVGIFSKPNE